MIRKLFPIVLAAALIGCSDAIGPSDLHVGIEVDQTTLTAGDSTHVRVIVTNISPRTVTIGTHDCPSPIRIYDARGSDVSSEEPFCTLALRLQNLKSGESYTFNYLWRPNLRPGTYFIRGYVRRGITSERVEIQIN